MLSSSRETLANFDVGKSSKFLKPFPLLLLFSLWYLSCLLRYPRASLFWTGSCRKETELELQISNFQKNPNKSRWVCPQLYLTPTLVRNFRSSSGVIKQDGFYAFRGSFILFFRYICINYNHINLSAVLYLWEAQC